MLRFNRLTPNVLALKYKVAIIVIECGGRNVDAVIGRAERGRYLQRAFSEL